MSQFPTLITIIWSLISCFADVGIGRADEKKDWDRRIVKEPEYQSTPKYSLLALRASGDIKVWMVEDGRRLFVDKNANGDLTDDGGPLEPKSVREFRNGHWDYRYTLNAIEPTDGSKHTQFVLRRWNYNDDEDKYGLSLSVDDLMPMYAGWFGTFWASEPEKAPVVHFGNPLTPRILRRKVFTVGETGSRLSLCFINPGSGDGTTSRLSIDALPKSVVPKLIIEWPTADGEPPRRTSHELVLRCCYWEFYSGLSIPKEVVPGEAKVSVVLPADQALIDLTTTDITIPVVAAKD